MNKSPHILSIMNQIAVDRKWIHPGGTMITNFDVVTNSNHFGIVIKCDINRRAIHQYCDYYMNNNGVSTKKLLHLDELFVKRLKEELELRVSLPFEMDIRFSGIPYVIGIDFDCVNEIRFDVYPKY